MPWVALDDQFLINPKARAAGLHGRALFVASLCWAGMQLNNGTFPASDLQAIAGLADILDPQAVADRLTTLGLWHPELHDCPSCRAVGQIVPVPSGHLAIHEYLGRNKSREQVIAEREGAAERKRRQREKSRGESRGTSNGSHAGGSASPSHPLPTGFSSLQSPNGLGTKADPVDNSTDGDSSAGNDDNAEASDVPAEVWDHFARIQYQRQPDGSVRNKPKWMASTRTNARQEHAEQAAAWWAKFDVTPDQLAAWLIDGQVSPYATLRPQEPA